MVEILLLVELLLPAPALAVHLTALSLAPPGLLPPPPGLALLLPRLLPRLLLTQKIVTGNGN